LLPTQFGDITKKAIQNYTGKDDYQVSSLCQPSFLIVRRHRDLKTALLSPVRGCHEKIDGKSFQWKEGQKIT
jgi:hypothetical protein